MNFLQLSQRLRQEVGGTGEGPSSVTNQVGEYKQYVDWVNRAYMEIQEDRADWGWLWAQGSESITTGQSLYSLESPTIDVNRVRIDDGYIQYVPYQSWNYYTLQEGKPTAFTLNPARELQVNSLPDQDYTLTYDYFKNPTLMANNSDVPLLPQRYHMLIVYKAMLYYGYYENAGEIIATAREQYAQMLAALDRDALPDGLAPGPIA